RVPTPLTGLRHRLLLPAARRRAARRRKMTSRKVSSSQTTRIFSPGRGVAKHLECAELAPAFGRGGWLKAPASRLHLTRISNPKGIVSSSPGLRGTSYPGSARAKHHQPQRVVPLFTPPLISYDSDCGIA